MPNINIDKDLVNKVAKNARINLTDEEIEKFLPQLEEVIINSFNKLDEISVEEEPSFQPIESKNCLRKDDVKEGITQEDVLKNVSSEIKEKGYIKGPKVL